LFEPSCLNLCLKFIKILVNSWHRLFSPVRIKNIFLILKFISNLLEIRYVCCVRCVALNSEL